MDTIQIILITVIVVLTMLLVFAGIQVLLILSDARRALKRVNSMLDDSLFGGGLLNTEKLTSLFQIFRKKKNNGI